MSTRRVTIRIPIHGVNTEAMIDTGAECSLVSEKYFYFLCQRTHRQPVVMKSKTVVGLSGHSLLVTGKTILNVTGDLLEVTIVRGLPHDVLLGDDFLRDGGGVIHYRRREVLIGDDWYAFQYSTSAKVTTRRAAACRWSSVYPSVFHQDKGPLGRVTTRCPINTGSHAPIRQRAYRTPLAKRLIVEAEVRKMLEDGVIRLSKSAWASPITLVPKKDGEIRFCIDYRKLNAVTVKDSHPLPLIQDIFDQLGGSTIFTTLDLKSGYWQVPMDEGSIEKTAFITHQGLYEFVVMPFGLCNAPAIFQRLMQEVLFDVLGKCCMVYLDDIVIYSKSPEEHEENTRKVLDRLGEAGVKLKQSKCTFDAEEVNLLGYIVSPKGITPDPAKTDAIMNLAQPSDVKEVRSFLGMANYYRQCVPNFAAVADPLTDLTRKHSRWTWTEKHQEAFDVLKRALVGADIMAMPDTSKPYRLYTDACDYAVGGILVQEVDGVERVIQYVSKKLDDRQKKWPVIEKEGWGVIYCLKKLRAYLYGAEFTILTDHKPLKSLFLGEMANTRVQRWAVLLAEFAAPIEYRKGRNNIRADMLSRIRTPEIAVIDTSDQWAIPPEEDVGETSIPWDGDGLDMDKVREEQATMDEYKRAVSEDDNQYELLNGLLYDHSEGNEQSPYPRLVLPPSCRWRVIRRAHTEVGHQSVSKTLWRLKEAYKWPGMRRDIKQVIARCAKCAINRDTMQHARPGDMPIATYPMQIMGMDLTGPFEASPEGNRYILTIIDHCTGWVEAKPIPSKCERNVLHFLDREFIPRFGTPEVIITDQGGEFNGRVLCDYMNKLNIDHRRTTPYHPQSNGKIERFHRTLKQIIRKLVTKWNSRWEEELGHALFAHRISTSIVTGYTPYFLMYGRRPRIPASSMLRRLEGEDPTVVGDRLDALASALKEAARNTEESRKHNKRRLEERATKEEIHPGDTIVVKNAKQHAFDASWNPQYEVIRVTGPVIKVRHQQSGRIRTVNRARVRAVPRDIVWDIPPPTQPIRRATRFIPRRQAPVGRQTTSRYEDDPDFRPPLPRYRLRSQVIETPEEQPEPEPNLRVRKRHLSDSAEDDDPEEKRLCIACVLQPCCCAALSAPLSSEMMES